MVTSRSLRFKRCFVISSKAPVFKFSLKVPRSVSVFETRVSREDFYEWLWAQFSQEGLLGVHEGTLLSQEAADEGLETDSWLVDSAQAPRERDWVGQVGESQAELYFSGHAEAQKAVSMLEQLTEIQVGRIEEQADQDWDAEWKASFLNSGQGVQVPPFWRIVPPWVDSLSDSSPEVRIKINPGAGFGTGTHETTQLCLRAIGEYCKGQSNGIRGLDFGSGSGILSVGMAFLGMQVDAVEVDLLAIDNARENAQLNGVQDQVRFSQNLSPLGEGYSVIVANILKPVLLEFAPELVKRLASQGILILSGLIEQDVEPVTEMYSELLRLPVAQVYELGEWRALVFLRFSKK